MELLVPLLESKLAVGEILTKFSLLLRLTEPAVCEPLLILLPLLLESVLVTRKPLVEVLPLLRKPELVTGKPLPEHPRRLRLVKAIPRQTLVEALSLPLEPEPVFVQPEPTVC